MVRYKMHIRKIITGLVSTMLLLATVNAPNNSIAAKAAKDFAIKQIAEAESDYITEEYATASDAELEAMEPTKLITAYDKLTWTQNEENTYLDIINTIWYSEERYNTLSLADNYITMNQLCNVLNRIEQEHPEWGTLVCNSNAKDMVTYTEDGYIDTFLFELSRTRDYRVQQTNEIGFAKQYIDDSMTPEERLLIAHDYIASEIVYTFKGDQTIGDLTFKGTICMGYRNEYKPLIIYSGIPVADASGMNHAWNVVLLDGKWYISDTTFDGNTYAKGYPGGCLRSGGHKYFLVGMDQHYENTETQKMEVIYDEEDISDQVEYNSPTKYWNFGDLNSQVIYHINAGEAHGKFYYLNKTNRLTTRDNILATGTATSYEDCQYDNLAWSNDTLYGLRNNNIYIIDWNTHEKTLIAYAKEGGYYLVNNNGDDKLLFDFDETAYTVKYIGAYQDKFYAYYASKTNSNDENIKFIMDLPSTNFVPAPLSDKKEVSGPTAEPEDFIYNIGSGWQLNMPYLQIEGYRNEPDWSEGVVLPEKFNGCTINAIDIPSIASKISKPITGELKIPKCYKSIKETFRGADGLTGDLDLTGLTGVGSFAFYGCTGLDGEVTLPDYKYFSGVGSNAFNGCSNIKKVNGFDSRVKSVGLNAFTGCENLEGEFDLTECTSVGKEAFKDCKKITIKNNALPKVTRLDVRVFENCENIKGELYIPSCTAIWNGVINGSGITGFTGTEKLKSLEANAFTGHSTLEGILELPAVDTINAGALTDENNLTAIRLSNPLLIITSSKALPSNTDVAVFIAKNSKAESVVKNSRTYGVNYWYIDDTLGSGTVDGYTWSIEASGAMTIATTEEAGDEVVIAGYSEATAPWDDYKKYVTSLNIDGGVTSISSGAFTDFINLVEVNITGRPDMEEDSFSGCTKLKSDKITLAECIHSFTNYISDGNATCTTDGTKTAKCDNKGCKETDTVADEGSALGHSFTKYDSDGNATCTTDGTKTAKCDNKGCEKTDTVVDEGSKGQHRFTHYIYNQDATCVKKGTKTAKCDGIGCTMTDTIVDEETVGPHHFTEYISNNDATCVANGTKTAKCDREGCDGTDTITDEGTVGPHSFTKYESDGNATCVANGTKTAKCDNKGCKEQDTVVDVNSKLSHMYSTKKVDEKYMKYRATYFVPNVYYYVCDMCGVQGNREVYAYGNVKKVGTPSITGVKIENKGLKLKWSKIVDATGYYVYRRDEGKTSYSRIATVAATTAIPSYKDNNVIAGKRYEYAIEAYIIASEKDAEIAKGTDVKVIANYTTVLSKKSSSVGSIYIAPVVVKTENKTTGIKITWSRVNGAKGYYVYRKIGTEAEVQIAMVDNPATITFTDKNAKNGKIYTYIIKAYNGSAISDSAAGSMIMRLNTPVINAKAEKGKATITWKKVTGASSYYIYRKTGSGAYKKIATVKGNSNLKYVDKKTKKGKKYTYAVSAYSKPYVSEKSKGKTINGK